MIHYTYYWYHHMMPDKDRKEIEKILTEKNYLGFIELYKKYTIKSIQYGSYYPEFQTWYPMVFLPDTISVWNDEDDSINHISILNKENFNKITYTECECG